jgi:hypothetical protein
VKDTLVLDAEVAKGRRTPFPFCARPRIGSIDHDDDIRRFEQTPACRTQISGGRTAPCAPRCFAVEDEHAEREPFGSRLKQRIGDDQR